eukprot:scaffold271_cov336-Pavlova_lutheri.AAC.21
MSARLVLARHPPSTSNQQSGGSGKDVRCAADAMQKIFLSNFRIEKKGLPFELGLIGRRPGPGRTEGPPLLDGYGS